MCLPFISLQASANSRNIIIGATYDGSLSNMTPVNYYFFDITESASVAVRLEFQSNARENAWRVSICRDGSNSALLTQDFGGDSGINTAFTIEYTDSVTLAPGRYYASVATPPGQPLFPGIYRVGVDLSAGASNNTIASAADMRVNEPVTGSVRSKADANYFKFHLPSSGSININFSVSSAIDSGSWTVLLYDKDEQQLQMARVGYNGTISDNTRTNRLDKQRLPAGDYYIKVVPHSESAANTAEYGLNVAYAPETGSRYEKEPNDTAETADSILINASVIGNMNNHEDYDYYKFEVSDYRDIKIEFSTPDSVNRMAWTVYLFDDKGGVATYNLGNTGTLINDRRMFASELLNLHAGAYYIAVFPYNLSASAYSNEDYTLCVRAEGAPVPIIADEESPYAPTEVPAAAYGVNQDLTGRISSASDVQKFDFGLNHSGLVYVTFQSPSEVARQSWTINIRDTNSKLVYSGRFGGEPVSSTGARTAESNRVRVPAGSYYAEILPVNAYDYSPAEYKYKINYAAESKEALNLEKERYEKEHNDTPSTANKIDPKQTVAGNMSDHEDIDYFKFSLDTNGSAAINFETLSSVNSNAWIVDLLKADLTEIYFGNFGAGEAGAGEYKKETSPSVRLPKGEYYIRVRAYNSIHFSNQDYRLTVDFKAENPDYFETEPNDTPQTASPLRINTDVTGNIFDANDLDYFKININETKDIQIKFSVDYRINQNYWSIKLFDPQLTQLKSYRIGEGGVLTPDGLKYFKTERINLPAGDYYILISPFTAGDYSNADYILKAVDALGQKIDIYNYAEDKPSSWAVREVGFAYGYDLVPVKYLRDFTAEMKRGEFCELMIRFLEISEAKKIDEILALQGKTASADTFTDTSEYHILAAYELGIVTGRGEGIFDPDGSITREEAAAMLMRLGVFSNIYINSQPLIFNDSQKFSSWAADAVSYVSSCTDSWGNRVMNGYTNGGFHPGDSYSREQAYMTIFRLFAIKKGLK
jgi:hypothetical protein